MNISDDELRGRPVITADGQVLGEIKRLFLDTDRWGVTSVLVELRSGSADQLGASRSLFRAAAIEVPIGAIQSVGDTVVLATRLEDLRGSVPRDASQGHGAMHA
jgi:sporulation protein YlmC with PRC-barrel domain